MYLCFGSLAMFLYSSRKNNSVKKKKVGRCLLSYIDPVYEAGKEDSFIYALMGQQRELAGTLKSQVWDRVKLSEQFNNFVNDNLTLDTAVLLVDLKALILGDESLSDDIKKHLLRLSEEMALDTFLAELLVFAVDNCSNKNKAKKEDHSSKRSIRQTKKIDSDKTLCKLAKEAILRNNAADFESSLRKMVNHIYISDVLIFLASQGNYAEGSYEDNIFHKTLSAMTNDRYRYEVLIKCLGEGFFDKNPERILELHFHEIENQLYLFRLLCYLHANGLSRIAEEYQFLLTHRTYLKRLSGILSDDIRMP